MAMPRDEAGDASGAVGVAGVCVVGVPLCVVKGAFGGRLNAEGAASVGRLPSARPFFSLAR